MTRVGLQFIDAKSAEGGLVTIDRIMAASEQEGFSLGDMEQAKKGLFLAEGMSAVGYVACKEIINAISHDPEVNGDFALVAGLYVLPEFRGQGHGTQLVRSLTNQLFTDKRGIKACSANCTPSSAPVFEAAGYTPLQIRKPDIKKLPYRLSRPEWLANQHAEA